MKISLLLTGASGAGKTTIVARLKKKIEDQEPINKILPEKLHHHSVTVIKPTQGMDASIFKLEDLQISVWDVAGGQGADLIMQSFFNAPTVPKLVLLVINATQDLDSQIDTHLKNFSNQLHLKANNCQYVVALVKGECLNAKGIHELMLFCQALETLLETKTSHKHVVRFLPAISDEANELFDIIQSYQPKPAVKEATAPKPTNKTEPEINPNGMALTRPPRPFNKIKQELIESYTSYSRLSRALTRHHRPRKKYLNQTLDPTTKKRPPHPI